MQLKPSEIYFSQAEINNRFDKNGNHRNVNLGKTLDDLVEGRCGISDIPKISFIKRDTRWVTADNRRLWVFRHLEKLGKCPPAGIEVDETFYIDSRKLNSLNGGRTVRFYSGRYAEGFWHQEVSNIDPHSGSQSESLESIMMSLGLMNADLQSELNPSDIRYTKESININTFFRNLEFNLRFGQKSQNDVDPVTVYKAFGKHWVAYGNKRVWSFKQAQSSRTTLKIKAEVNDDKEEFLDAIRTERPLLSLIDILQ